MIIVIGRISICRMYSGKVISNYTNGDTSYKHGYHLMCKGHSPRVFEIVIIGLTHKSVFHKWLFSFKAHPNKITFSFKAHIIRHPIWTFKFWCQVGTLKYFQCNHPSRCYLITKTDSLSLTGLSILVYLYYGLAIIFFRYLLSWHLCFRIFKCSTFKSSCFHYTSQPI